MLGYEKFQNLIPDYKKENLYASILVIGIIDPFCVLWCDKCQGRLSANLVNYDLK